jgi:hypothetical protein
LLKCERWRECKGAIKKIERRKGERLRKQERWNVEIGRVKVRELNPN